MRVLQLVSLKLSCRKDMEHPVKGVLQYPSLLFSP